MTIYYEKMFSESSSDIWISGSILSINIFLWSDFLVEQFTRKRKL